MDNASVFNLVVCVLGIAIFVIHIADLIFKKNKRQDEKNLLLFFIITAIHFALYLAFIFLKIKYKNDILITTAYTIFYIMNNVEILMLFLYAISYISLKNKTRNILGIINLSLFTIFIILDIVNAFIPIFFVSRGGVYQRTDFMIISQIYQFIGFGMVFFITLLNKKLDITSKIAFVSYCLLPFLGIIFQHRFEGYAIGYLSIVISIEVLFLFVNMRKNNDLAAEEKRVKEAEVKIMMSQIQPHFIYNTLASISTLITIDAEKAQQGLDDFTEYLRTNLSLINSNTLISFEDELKHIETYLSLEKMRFEERLNIVYDIKTKDFMIPPLSVQPIVENAVKHGILKKVDGGTITLKTYQTSDAFVIEINDDGVGFDIKTIKDLDNSHIGINNVKARLKNIVNGELYIQSAPATGTRVKIVLPK